MRTTRVAGRFLPLLAVLVVAACAQPAHELLPDPGPPAPRAPAPPPARQPEQRARGAPAHREPPPPAFAVAIVRADGNRHTVDGPLTSHTVNVLAHNGFAARPAPAPADLPPAIAAAAIATAAAEKGAPATPEVFVLGAVSTAPPAAGGTGSRIQVRMAAVDRSSGKPIGECGFQSLTAEPESILQKAMEDLLGQVMIYWRQSPDTRE